LGPGEKEAVRTCQAQRDLMMERLSLVWSWSCVESRREGSGKDLSSAERLEEERPSSRSWLMKVSRWVQAGKDLSSAKRLEEERPSSRSCLVKFSLWVQARRRREVCGRWFHERSLGSSSVGAGPRKALDRGRFFWLRRQLLAIASTTSPFRHPRSFRARPWKEGRFDRNAT
jgi:hypothetical protein